MQLPDIATRIGRSDGEDRIYIEDYVYTYLNEVRAQNRFLPVRAALFGHACSNEDKKIYLIYGAACVVEELQNGRTEEQLRQKFFKEYELIGYVNIYGNHAASPDRQDGWPEGCCVFYDSNESMQNYLIFRYKQKNKEAERREEQVNVPGLGKCQEKLKSSVFEMIIQMLFYGICIVLLAIAVTTINDYSQMYGFMEEAARAAAIME